MPPPNQIIDPGAELNDPAWTYDFGAVRTSAFGSHTGSWAFFIRKTAAFLTGGTITQTLDLPTGTRFSLLLYGNGLFSGGLGAIFWFDPGDGVFVEVETKVFGASWELWTLPTQTTTATDPRIRFEFDQPGPDGNGVLLDSMEAYAIGRDLPAPENGLYPRPLMRQWLQDHRSGVLRPEDEMVRDDGDLVVRADQDAPDRDTLKREWTRIDPPVPDELEPGVD